MGRGAQSISLVTEERLDIEGDDSVHDRLVALMNRYELPLYRFLFVLLDDREAATDCAQDTFLRAHDNLQKGKSVNGAWLYKVARNRAMDEYRRRRRERPALQRLAHSSTQPASPEDRVVMHEAFAQLDPDDRTVLYLSAVQGFNGMEIAEMLSIKPTAARMRICRARERFRLAYGCGT